MKSRKLIFAAVGPLFVLCLAVPVSAAVSDTDINVKGKYEGNYEGMSTLVLGKTDNLSLGGGQTMRISLTNKLDYGLRMVVTPVSRSAAESYAWLSGQTSGTGTSPYAWHIAFYEGGTKAALDGEAVIHITIPSGYTNAVFYYMDNRGNLSRIWTQKQGNTLSFTAQNCGYYLFLKPLSSSRDSSSNSSSSAGTITNDRKKGVTHSENGILTGTTGSTVSDGLSHWILDNNGWRLRYADGTYASGTLKNGTEIPLWEKINGSWYLFGADSYAIFGWYLDIATGSWYYLDINTGMKIGWHEDPQDGRWYYLKADGTMATGWMQIGGKWYYFNAHALESTWEYNPTKRIWNYRIDSNGRPYGSMYQNEQTPDGCLVDENGVWNG